MSHMEMLEKLVELKIVFQIGANDEGEPYWGLHLDGSNSDSELDYFFADTLIEAIVALYEEAIKTYPERFK